METPPQHAPLQNTPESRTKIRPSVFESARTLLSQVLPFLAAGACADPLPTQLELCTNSSFSSEGVPGMHEVPENLSFRTGPLYLETDSTMKTVRFFAETDWSIFPPKYPKEVQNTDELEPEVTGVKAKAKDRMRFETKETYDVNVFGTDMEVTRHYNFEHSIPDSNDTHVDVTVDSDLFPGGQRVWATSLLVNKDAFEDYIANRTPLAEEDAEPTPDQLSLEYCTSLLQDASSP